MTEMYLDRHSTREAETDWWKNTVVYQIYPRSFADTNGDGLCDLPGVTSKPNYLQDRGMDAIWMSPFYPSPLADGGYDVSDYCDVDPCRGTLNDFIVLVESAHQRGLKVIIDVVPNHTSNEHPWFREALASLPGSTERDRYIFRDGSGERPPTDWQSRSGGSAWEQTPDGQWYCHLFDKAQPDLNWDNEEVGEYFLSVLRFWADRGVDGFHVDVAHPLVKDLNAPLRDQPNLDLALPLDGSDLLYDRDGVHEVYRSWRKVFNAYFPPLMAVSETWSPANSRTFLYARPDELGQVFDFPLLKSSWSRDLYRDTIDTSLADQQSIAGHAGGNTWVLSSHDVPRHASRFALPAGVSAGAWLLSDGLDPVIDEDRGQRRASALPDRIRKVPPWQLRDFPQAQFLALVEVGGSWEGEHHQRRSQRNGPGPRSPHPPHRHHPAQRCRRRLSAVPSHTWSKTLELSSAHVWWRQASVHQICLRSFDGHARV